MIFPKTGRDIDTRRALHRVGEDYETSVFRGLTTGFEAGYVAPGSSIEDVQARTVSQEMGVETTFMQDVSHALTWGAEDTRKGVSMSKEQYEDSIFFREEVEYQEDMTFGTAGILAEREDAARTREFLMQRTSKVGATAAFVGTLAGAFADVKSVVAGVAAGGIFGLGAKAVNAVRVAESTLAATSATRATMATKAAVVAGEAIVGTVPSAVSGLQNEPLLRTEYGIEDAFIDLGASAIFSVALSGGISAGKSAYKKYATVKERAQAADIARTQFRANEEIDIDPIMEAQMAEKIETFSTIKSGDKPTARVKADGTVEMRYADETGAMSGVVGRGANAEEAFKDLQRLYSEDMGASAKQLGMEETQLRLIKEVHDLKSQKTEFDIDDEIINAARERGDEIPEFKAADEELGTAQKALIDAEKKLSKRKASAERQAAVANAKQRVARAEETLEKLRDTPEMRAIVDEVLSNQRTLLEAHSAKSAELKNLQRAAVQEQTKKYAADQTDPELNKSRSKDPAVRAVDQAEVERLAAEAPEPQEGTRLSTESRQAVEEMIQSDTLDPSTKEILEQGLKDVDDARRRGQALRNWWKCRGGS